MTDRKTRFSGLRHSFTLAALMALAASPCANAASSPTVSIRVANIDLHPDSAAAAGGLLARIEDAALNACGATGFSLADYRRAVRRSPCWRQSVSDAVLRIGNPLLSDLYRRESAR